MMQDDTLPAAAPPAADAWLAPMTALAEEDGYLERLGGQHWAFFAETGPELLVTFERAESIRSRPSKLPAAWELAQKNGWSLLCIIAEGETFWRAAEVWGYFDRLADEAFFDDFEQLLFYGAGPAGYAAACYSVAGPGAQALLLSPLATLAPDIAGFDRRYRRARRYDFSSRYGFGPDMIEGLEQVWLIHDPTAPEEAAHAALYRRPWVTVLRARWIGAQLEAVMQATGLWPELIEAAMQGGLSRRRFAKFWRKRRESVAYLTRLLGRAQAAGRSEHEAMICRSAVSRLRLPAFQRHLSRLITAKPSPAHPQPNANAPTESA